NGNDALLEFVGESESYVSFMSTNVSIVNSGHLSANIIEQLYLENSSINMANNSKFTAEESQIILSDDSAIAMNRSSFTIDNHSSMTLQYESSLSLLNHSNVEIKGYSHLNLLSDSTIKGESEKISEDLLGSRIILNKSEADFEAGTTITGIDGSRWTGITFIDCASSNEFPFTSHIRSSIISDISSLNVSTSTVKFNDIIIENIGKFNAVRSNILIDNMIYRDNDHPISALQGTLNIDNSTIHNNASHGVYLFDIAVVKEVKEHSVPSTRIIPYQVEVDTLRYVSQLRNSEVYSNQGIGVFVSTGSIFLKNTKVYGNGKDLSYVDDVYDGAGFYSTSLTRSTLSIGSIIRGNKNYDIYCRANKWPSFGLSANGSSGFSYVGCGNTNPAVFLFPQQHYFYAFGDFTPPIASYNVNVPTSDSDLFYPSLSSFDLGYPTNPAVMNAYTQYIEALEAMYEGEYERAYDELQDFIEENADVVSLNSEVLSALTLLPYLASAIEGRTEYLNEFIAGLEEEVFGIHLGYATLTSKVLDEDYVEAMQVINDLLEDIDDPDDIDSILLELEAAHLYLILVLENVRSIPSATYQPTTYEEFYAIQEDLERKIMRLNAKNDTEPPVPAVTKLTVSNYPNPFNPETVIAYAIPRDSNVKIDVYNIKGQRVKRLVNELHTSGHHSVVWTGFDDAGNSVSSGLYFYRVQTDDSVVTKKMILMK
ncbi:MAG: T9SS type A sorting domain-containing protein, partial [Candidatus Cloacimonetes bacterium]|nr:T9SS type A sorting domain-containing protein [Candidatus Cloacimonadota bacterium]